MRHTAEMKRYIGIKLAKHFLAGLNRKQCVQEVFPKMNENSARKNAPHIFRRYEVNERAKELLPKTVSKKDVEGLLNYILENALNKKDDFLILQIIDRIAKIQGRYTEKIEISNSDLEKEKQELEEAHQVLKRANVDPTKINLN